MVNIFNKKLLIVCGAIFLALSAMFASFFYFINNNQPGPENSAENTQGVSAGEILFGSSLALSGHASYLGTDYLHGALSYLNEVNENGGIYGRKIRIISYDDRYDPPQTIINTQKLINKDRVFALFNYVGTPTAVKIIPIVEEAKIPLLGLFTGANALRSPFNKYIFNIRTSYYQETELAAVYFVDHLSLKKIAVFYQADAYGADGTEGAKIALKKRGLEPVAAEFYIRGTVNVEQAAEKIVNSGAEAVIMIGTYSPSAKFVKLAKEKNPRLFFYSVSFVGPEEFARDLEGKTDGVFVTQVVPPPDTSDQLEGVKKFKENLAKYYPEEKPSMGGLEGFINAAVLVEGLKRGGENITRESFISSLESIKDFSVGTGDTLSFGPDDRQGLEKTYFTFIKDGAFFILDM